MSKISSRDPFGHLNISYDQKKDWESKCQFDYQSLKVGNHSDFLVFRWHDTYHWKAFDKGYNFALDLASIKSLHTKLWASKIVGVLISRISKFQFGSFGTKIHLGVGPVAKHREYYKGEGGGFPQVRAVVSLMNPYLPVVNQCTKSVPIPH
jgi:hypothetical protein